MIKKLFFSHFLLMFGYKLFSAYFALYLVDQGLEFAQVGYSYFFIYIAFVVVAPFIGVLEHKVNPALLAGVGIFGYATYSLGMLTVPPGVVFYLLQIMLGVSAAFFFVASRTMLIHSHPVHHDASFGWFYSAAIYAEFIAPIVGGIILLFFGFPGIFIASIVIYILDIIFSTSKTREIKQPESVPQINKGSIENYAAIFSQLKGTKILPLLFFSFTVIVVNGFYGPFLILFLKDIGLARSEIVAYISIFSAALIPLSFFVIKFLKKATRYEGIVASGLIHSFSSFVFGIFGAKINIGALLGVNTFKSLGGFITNSKRSGTISKDFPQYSVEAGVIDSVFSPFGVAIGALIGGFIVSNFGFQALFIIGGTAVLISSVITSLLIRKEK